MNFLKKGWVYKGLALILTYVVVYFLVDAYIIDDYLMTMLVTIGINIVLAVSLNLITGFTGQFSLGHAGFMAIGAYSCAIVTSYWSPTVWGFLAGVLLGSVLAAIVGLLVGIPTLRLQGDYLAIATLGMAEIIRILFLNAEFTNGAAGMDSIPKNLTWTWLFVFVVGTVLVISNFLKSAPGRACISIREDEIAAASIGVNAFRAKIMAFVIGAFFGGMAGAMYSSFFYFIKPDLFGFLKSIDILVIVVLGGLGSLSGSILAAFLLAIVTIFLQNIPELRMVLYALVLVIIMIFRPEGIMGSRELSLKMFGKLIPGKRKKESMA